MSAFHSPTPQQIQQEAARRQFLQAQAQSMLRRDGQLPTSAPTMPPLFSLPACEPPQASQSRVEAIKTLGLYRKSIKMRPVISGYTPRKVWKPVVFPHTPGQQLTKLSRDVSREWVQLLVNVSSASLAGGKLNGSQGRNLVRIVEELRKHCYLKVDADGNPTKVREQVVQVVDGSSFCFAQECGMSARTFYRALAHPLAHCFIRTQKVQRIGADGESRCNCATLFSVALFEPEIPADLEAAYWSELVEMEGEFVVPDFNCQDDACKRRPLLQQKQNEACGKLTAQLRGASFQAIDGQAREGFLRWVDAAALGSNRKTQPFADSDDTELEGCIDRLRTGNPGLWEYAVQIAIHHDEQPNHAVAAIGYYKALVHIGVPKVRRWVQRLEKWRLKGQRIDTPGRLLMHHLNREARAVTGFNIRDLGTEREEMLA